MKTIFAIVLLGMLMSCGKSSNGTGSNSTLGNVKSLNALSISSNDRTKITKICQSLATKAQNLNLSPTLSLTFNVAQKDCNQSLLAPSVATEVFTQKVGSNFLFKRRVDNLDFIYPDVETDSSGIMGSICPTLGDLKNPIQLSDSQAIWFYVDSALIASSDCVTTAQEQCVLIETGNLENGKFKIAKKEWMKFRIDPNFSKLGFYTFRKTLSSSFCGLNKSQEIQASLLNP